MKKNVNANCCRSTFCHHQGFMLVMVLVLLAIVGTTGAALARRSMAQSTWALQEERQLQRKWSIRSTDDVFAGSAEKVLQFAESGSLEPVQRVTFEFKLNQMSMHVLLSDEQAQPNVQVLDETLGLTRAESVISGLTRQQHVASSIVQVRLRPLEPTMLALVGEDAVSRHWPRYSGYSAVFNDPDLAKILSHSLRDALDNPASQFSSKATTAIFKPQPGVGITCWGNGKLHFARATKSALLAVSEEVVGLHHVNRLIELRQNQPGLDSQMAIDQLDLTLKERDLLQERMTDKSQCHALVVWVKEEKRHHIFMRIEEIRNDGGLISHQYEQTWP